MYWKIFKSIFVLLLAIIFLGFPKQSYADYCTIELFYKPTLVIATAENQTTSCGGYITTINFKTNYTIKGSPSDQFEINGVNPGITNTCEIDFNKPNPLDTRTIFDRQFETGKKYLLSIFPRNQDSAKADLVTRCRYSTATEVTGLFDPQVIKSVIVVYFQPIWVIEFIPTMLLGLLLYRFIPNIFSFILSGIIVLILNGIVIVLLFRLVRKIIRRTKNTQKVTNS